MPQRRLVLDEATAKKGRRRCSTRIFGRANANCTTTGRPLVRSFALFPRVSREKNFAGAQFQLVDMPGARGVGLDGRRKIRDGVAVAVSPGQNPVRFR